MGIEINGILWDNDVVRGDNDEELFFTFDEALEKAKSLNKRLPTCKELKEMIEYEKYEENPYNRKWYNDLFIVPRDHYSMNTKTEKFVNCSDTIYYFLDNNQRCVFLPKTYNVDKKSIFYRKDHIYIFPEKYSDWDKLKTLLLLVQDKKIES